MVVRFSAIYNGMVSQLATNLFFGHTGRWVRLSSPCRSVRIGKFKAAAEKVYYPG